ncbi:hypothetical protein BD626DRAFT_131352 [Schizophyllum amplum]|uniref:Uncharacterized protein n=1 Tax=Schizophyllum amplum TaxID=97359 RepID=A0A550C6E6_9AGAR|nr:hypothetical protein BD626DRAFT_131352 [Auriculariopsis ampla]
MRPEDTQRLRQAAVAFSQLLRSHDIPHAFHGDLLVALVARKPLCDEMACIVENGQRHAFRRVRDALVTSDDFRTVHSPWTNRLHVTYTDVIPAIEFEILPAGETGPRRLTSNTVMKIQGVPFLTVTEYVRAKLTSWIIRRLDLDAHDLMYVLGRYWNNVDANRIPESDMNVFVTENLEAAPPWAAIRRKYEM